MRIPHGGADARIQAQYKRNAIAAWLWDWWFMTPAVVRDLLQLKHAAADRTISQMVAANLLQVVPAPGIPGRLVMLTSAGIDFASTQLHPEKALALRAPPIHPSRLNLSTAQHELIAQHLALEARNQLTQKGISLDDLIIKPAREISSQNYERADAIPDSILQIPSRGLQLDLEVQESYDQRMPRRLAQLCERIARANQARPNSRFALFGSSNPSLLAYYRKLVADDQLQVWAFQKGPNKWATVSGMRNPHTSVAAPNIDWKLVSRASFYRF